MQKIDKKRSKMIEFLSNKVIAKINALYPSPDLGQ